MDNQEYDLFDLKISGSPAAGFQVDLLHSELGESKSVDFELPFNQDQIDNFVLRMEKQSTGKRASPALAERQKVVARDFGNALFHALFEQTDLEQLLKRSMDRAETAGRGVMLRLRLGEAESLGGVPWEYMHGDDSDGFLALSSSMPIVRYLEVSGAKTPTVVDPPARVLVVISSPRSDEYARLDSDAEWQALQDSTAELRAANRLVLERLDVATLSVLSARLEKGDVHVVHFIGHGDFHETLGGTLILENDDESARVVPGDELLVALKGAGLRLVLLNSCEGARTRVDQTFSPARRHTENAFAGIAQQLVRGGVPAVVAMQFEISDTAAVAFAKYFYRALNEGESIDRSVSLARKGLYNSGNFLEWATPVVFTRSVNNRLLEPIGPTDNDPTDKNPADSADPIDGAPTVGAAPLGFADLGTPVDDTRDIASVVTRALTMVGFDGLRVQADELEVRVLGAFDSLEQQDTVENLVKSSLVGLGVPRIITLVPETQPPPPPPAAMRAEPTQPVEAARPSRLKQFLLLAAGVSGMAVLGLMMLGILLYFLVSFTAGSSDPDVGPVDSPTSEPIDEPTPAPQETTSSAVENRLNQLGLPSLQVTESSDVISDLITTPTEDPVVIVSGDVDAPADIVDLVTAARQASAETGGEQVLIDVVTPIEDIGVMRVVADDDEAVATVLVDAQRNADRVRGIAQATLDELDVDSTNVTVQVVDQIVIEQLAERAPYPGAFDDLAISFDGREIAITGVIDQSNHAVAVSDALAAAAASLANSSGIDREFVGPTDLVVLEDELRTALAQDFPQLTATLDQGSVVVVGPVATQAAGAEATAVVETLLVRLGIDRPIDTNFDLLSVALEEALADGGVPAATVTVAAGGATVFVPPGDSQDEDASVIIASELDDLGFGDVDVTVIANDPSSAIADSLAPPGPLVLASQVQVGAAEILVSGVCLTDPDLQAQFQANASAVAQDFGFDQAVVVEFIYCDLALTGSTTDLLVMLGTAMLGAGSMFVGAAHVATHRTSKPGRRRARGLSGTTTGLADHQRRRR